jgi:hypothetical protein
MFNKFCSENRDVYKIKWKNTVEWCRPHDNIVRPIRFRSWIFKATNTNTKYIIVIAFPQHKWLHERASLLRHTYCTLLHHTYCTLPVLLFSCAFSFHQFPVTTKDTNCRLGCEICHYESWREIIREEVDQHVYLHVSQIHNGCVAPNYTPVSMCWM